MATRKRRVQELDPGVSALSKEDDADILDEVEAETDESGGLLADEKKILEVGAVDSDSVRENRRLEQFVDKKRGNVKNVPFNVSDILTKYETLLKFWLANTIDISVRRLTGPPVQHVITSRPRSGSELYEAIKVIHGSYGEAEYEIKFFDSNVKTFRGNGRITMPDTRPQPGQPQYAAPPAYPQMTYPAPPPMYPQQVAPPAPSPQPTQQLPQQPSPDTMGSMMGSLSQMFEMFHSMQQRLAPPPTPSAPAAMYQPPPPPAPPQQFMMPPPPSTPDPGAMMEWMRQMFEMFQRMQAQLQPPTQTMPPPSSPNPPSGGDSGPQNSMMAMMGMGMPPMQPPPGTMWVPGFGFISVEQLMAVVSGGGRPRASHRQNDGPPPYMRDDGPTPYMRREGFTPPPPPPPPQRAQTPAEQFREAATVLRTAVDAVNEVHGLFPGFSGGGHEEREPPSPPMNEDDDNPVRFIDTGAAKIVVNKSDGSLRGIETLWANADKILKWAGEQREQIQRANMEQQRPAQLPPGYVEVGPGYKPPPGYVAVPVHQSAPPQPHPQQQELPHPPTRMPPPLWGPPEIPE